jgi:hypothetical protein
MIIKTLFYSRYILTRPWKTSDLINSEKLDEPQMETNNTTVDDTDQYPDAPPGYLDLTPMIPYP